MKVMNKRMKKLFILPYLGKYPIWVSQYKKNIASLKQYGWDWLFPTMEVTNRLIEEKLGIVPRISAREDARKIGDIHPMMGVIFEDYLKGYDFWCNTDLDVVYGRLDRYYSDDFLKDCDIYGDDPDALCGCFTLYRNIPEVNNLFRKELDWEDIVGTDEYYAYDEEGMTNIVRRYSDVIRFKSGHNQQLDPYDDSDVKMEQDGTLLDHGKEICLFHFRHTKRYPL